MSKVSGAQSRPQTGEPNTATQRGNDMNRSRWQMTAPDASHSHPRPPHLPPALPISTWLKQQRHPRTRTPCQSPRHTPTSGTRTPARPRSRTFSPRHANHVVCALRRELSSHAMQYKPSMVQDDGTKPVSEPSSPARTVKFTTYVQWLWVKRAAPSREDTKADAATEEAIELREYISVFPAT